MRIESHSDFQDMLLVIAGTIFRNLAFLDSHICSIAFLGKSSYRHTRFYHIQSIFL